MNYVTMIRDSVEQEVRYCEDVMAGLEAKGEHELAVRMWGRHRKRMLDALLTLQLENFAGGPREMFWRQ